MVKKAYDLGLMNISGKNFRFLPLKSLAEIYFQNEKVPTKYGGLGFGCFESSTLSEILGYGCTGIAVALGGNGLAVIRILNFN